MKQAVATNNPKLICNTWQHLAHFYTSHLPHLNEEMVGAFFTPEAERSTEQAETVKLSSQPVEELVNADVIVIGAPMYNFSIVGLYWPERYRLHSY